MGHTHIAQQAFNGMEMQLGGTDLYVKVVQKAGRRVKRLCVLFGAHSALLVIWYCGGLVVLAGGDTVYPDCLSSAFPQISLLLASGWCMHVHHQAFQHPWRLRSVYHRSRAVHSL